MTIYGLYDPKNKLRRVHWDRSELVANAFDFQTDKFRSKYWKRWTPAWNAAKRAAHHKTSKGWRLKFFPVRRLGFSVAKNAAIMFRKQFEARCWANNGVNY